MDHAVTTVVAIGLAIVGLAIIAVLVSGKSNTTGVLSRGGGAFQQAINCALAPVTGANCASLTEQVTSSITF